jgi:capsular polysaccharide export protein
MALEKSILLLQSPMSFFFKDLGEFFLSKKYQVIKINFNYGDKHFSGNLKNQIDYSDKIENFSNFLLNLHQQKNFTDIYLYGDCRPYHLIAINFAKNNNIKINVFEEGYLRPYWVTLEEGGVNKNSTLPKNKNFYNNLPEVPEEVKSHKKIKGRFKKIFNYTFVYYYYLLFYKKYFPHYLPHRPEKPFNQFILWNRKYFLYPISNFYAKIYQKIILENKPYFLVTLQLGTDAQIVNHSDFKSMKHFIIYIIKNYLKNCPSENSLVFKLHPLDNQAFVNKRIIKKFIIKYQKQNKIFFIDGGNLPILVKNAKGLITVNSTSAMSALYHGTPVKCLASAIYNFESLTDDNPIEEFWKSQTKPNHQLFLKFEKYLLENTQIEGNFYTDEGIQQILESNRLK